MSSTLTRATLSALMLIVVVLAPEAMAGPPGRLAVDATLYELTENMTVEGGVRTALAALQGSARVGSPLCPTLLAAALAPGENCTVTAIGHDEVDVNPYSPDFGKGRLWGAYAVVLNKDNPVDAAEAVVMTGRFEADMHLVVTADGILPLITIANGTLTPDPNPFGVEEATFSGVFRLPFTVSNRGRFEKPRRNVPAFYLTDNGKTERAKLEEYSLGMPTVRVEVTFHE